MLISTSEFSWGGGVRPEVRKIRPYQIARKRVPSAVNSVSTMNPLRSLSLATFLLALLGLRAQAAEALSFNRDIRPILSDKCYYCHGFDPKQRKADRRLDTLDGATAEIEGVRAIVPGDLKKSEAWLRIISDGQGGVMPPPKSHKTLSAAEKETIKRWIEQGAKYQKHWSFEPPQRAALPAVKDQAWVRNPIDAFVLARLEKAGLKPAPEADRRTLARRVSLDLDRPAAEAGGGRGVCERHRAGRLRKAGRAAHGHAAVGRASRPLLARCGALCGHARHPYRQLPRDVAVPRLGDRGVQSQPCRSINSRSNKSPATCCRTRRATSSSPPAFIAATRRRARAGRSTRRTARDTTRTIA